jgi:hypothetical protein
VREVKFMLEEVCGLGGEAGRPSYSFIPLTRPPHPVFPPTRSPPPGIPAPPQAAGVLCDVKAAQSAKQGSPLDGAALEQYRGEIRNRFEAEAHPLYATARLWDDGIILPEQSREALALALAVADHAPKEETKFGVFRM